MASAAGLRAGRAYVETGVDNNPLSAGLRAASAKLKAFGASLQSVGMSMGAAGAAMLSPFAAATLTFASFERQMARVKAISGATPEEFARLSAEAKHLGEVTEYSASQAAAMMTEFATRGYKVDDMLKATGPSLQMATAGQLELAEAAGIAGDIMGGMRIQAKDLGEVTDKLTYAFSNSATDLRQLGEAFKYVGPSASDMGFSLDEVSSALMVLANNGQKADMAGTTLRGIFETLKDPPSEARKELEKLGVVLDNGHGQFRRLDEIIGDMQQGLSKLSKVDKAAAISRIFTNRQTTGTSILVGENDKGVANVDVMRDFQGRLANEAGGTGARVQATMLDTLWGSWKLIESAVEGVAITIGETLMPTLREMGAAAIASVATFHEIIKANREWIPIIAKAAMAVIGIGSALVVVGGAVGILSFALGGLATLGTALVAIFSGTGMAIMAVGAAVSAAAVAIYNMEGSGEALKVVLGAIVAGAFLGVAAIRTLIVEVQAGFGYAMDAAKQFGNYLTSTFPALTSSLSDGFGGLASSLSGLFDSVYATFGKTWGGIINAISSGDFQAAGRVAWAGMEVIWLKGVNWLSGVWRGFTGYFVEAFHSATFEIAKTVNSVWSGLEKIWFESFNLIATAWGYLMDFMRKTFVSATAGFKIQWAAVQASVGAITVKQATEMGAEAGMAATRDREAIDAERKSENATIERNRQAIETRRIEAEGGMLDAQIAGKNNRREARMQAEADEAEKLAKAEDELRKAIIATLPFDRSIFESDGESMLLNDKAPTKQSLDSAAERATGGVSGGSAGTFDASMLRFLAGTGNEDILQKRQTEAAEKAAERLQRLIDIARDSSNNTYT